MTPELMFKRAALPSSERKLTWRIN